MTMTKKILIALAVLSVIGLYAYVYRDAFKPQPVQIFHRVMAGRSMQQRGRFGMNPNQNAVVFGLNRKLQLTDLKVVSLAALATNAEALPLWHLVSASNSIPVKMFVYGDDIRGLTPYVKGTHAQPLEPNVPYRLLLQAGSQAGQHDFKIEGTK